MFSITKVNINGDSYLYFHIFNKIDFHINEKEINYDNIKKFIINIENCEKESFLLRNVKSITMEITQTIKIGIENEKCYISYFLINRNLNNYIKQDYINFKVNINNFEMLTQLKNLLQK